MTQEHTQLLLKDLSARLPYGVVIQITSDGGMVEASYDMRLDAGLLADLLHSEDDFMPYLRPMSSMTKEERLVYEQRLHDVGRSIDVIDADDVVPHIDWLLSNHFDYRGLIPMGLALAAPERMYKTE